MKRGSIKLVGAGPGDPDLLTIAALRALQSADVVLYDDLVSEEILALVPPATKRVHVGKRGYRPSCKQPDINVQIVEWARQGLDVVRLKSGDPLIFGRAGEEIEACAAAGFEVEVIPGVTSAQGAAARLGVSLTHRDHARRLQLITGHDRHGVLPEEIHWDAIADPTATTVVYMPLRTVRELMEKAIRLGLPGDIPAVAVANATRRNQQVLHATASTVADSLERNPIGTPVLIMLGRVFAKE